MNTKERLIALLKEVAAIPGAPEAKAVRNKKMKGMVDQHDEA